MTTQVENILRPAVVFTMILALVGCSLFRSTTQMVNVSCSQADAKLYINGKEDKNPYQAEVARNKTLFIQCQKEGYEVATRPVTYHLNTTGYLDIIGGFIIIIPFIGLITPGAFSLEHTDITLQMCPLPGPEPSPVPNT